MAGTPLSLRLSDALAAHQRGELAAAEQGYRAVLRKEPRHADASYLLGVLLHATGRSREALGVLRGSLDAHPARPDVLNTLGDAHRVLGEYAAAREALTQALAMRPHDAAIVHNLAVTLAAMGARADALMLLFDEVHTAPNISSLRSLLASLLEGVSLGSGNALVRDVLEQLVRDDTIATQSIAGAIIGLCKSSAAFTTLLPLAVRKDEREQHHEPLGESAADAVRALSADALLTAALPRMIAGDEQLEQVLRFLRRRYTTNEPMRMWMPREFVAALAMQCFQTEYAWGMTLGERERLAESQAQLSSMLGSPVTHSDALESVVLLCALGAPLASVANWTRLSEIPRDAWSNELGLIIDAQIADVLEERRLAASLATDLTTRDEVSSRVREMYEENPYPRWVMAQRPPSQPTALFIASMTRRNPANVGTPPRLLVAGCGTGQQAIHLAMTHPDAQVEAIDLSLASLAYGARMATRLGVSNVRFSQGDLLELSPHGDPYDLISCSGVLHHLREPLVGWRRLLTRLAPHGVMKIGLYSTMARTSITAAQAYVSSLGTEHTVEGVRSARSALLALPATHPAAGVRQFLDFFTLSGLRDLVMHVQERTYSVPELKADLEALNLQFLGFQLPQTIMAEFHREYSAPNGVTDLDAWHGFEQRHPSTFVAMYQFWCAPR